LSHRQEDVEVAIPKDIAQEDILFSYKGLVPVGKAEQIRYVIFVDPEKYREMPDNASRLELGRIIGRLNKLLEDGRFILIGPGRWGSANIDLGVRVTYADIYNTKVLIELAVPQGGKPPELSYGTHFFQDLVESGIYALPIHLPEPGNMFDWTFFREAPSCLGQFLPDDAQYEPFIRLVDIEAVRPGCRLNILMDGMNSDTAVGYLVPAEIDDSVIVTEPSYTGIPS
jgi:hypothetical protein